MSVSEPERTKLGPGSQVNCSARRHFSQEVQDEQPLTERYVLTPKQTALNI